MHFELGRYCSLLEKGNPAATQLLFATDDSVEFISHHWVRLREGRDAFVTQRVAQSLLALVRRQDAHGAAGCSVLLAHTWRLTVGAGSLPLSGQSDAELAAAIDGDGAAVARLPQQYDGRLLDQWHAQVRIAYLCQSAHEAK